MAEIPMFPLMPETPTQAFTQGGAAMDQQRQQLFQDLMTVSGIPQAGGLYGIQQQNQPLHPAIQGYFQRMLSGQMTPQEAGVHANLEVNGQHPNPQFSGPAQGGMTGGAAPVPGASMTSGLGPNGAPPIPTSVPVQEPPPEALASMGIAPNAPASQQPAVAQRVAQPSMQDARASVGMASSGVPALDFSKPFLRKDLPPLMGIQQTQTRRDITTQKEEGKGTREEKALEVKKSEGAANRAASETRTQERTRTQREIARTRAETQKEEGAARRTQKDRESEARRLQQLDNQSFIAQRDALHRRYQVLKSKQDMLRSLRTADPKKNPMAGPQADALEQEIKAEHARIDADANAWHTEATKRAQSYGTRYGATPTFEEE